MDPISTPSPKSPLEAWGFTWGGWLDNRHGEWWLLAQLLLIAAHALPPWPQLSAWGVIWPLVLSRLGLLLFVLGLLEAGLAFWRLGFSLSPLPDPKPGAALVTGGLYALCRHPMYQAVLLCSLGVVLFKASLLHLLLLFSLAAVLGGKARREERLLRAIHPGYGAYSLSTPAIVPGLPWLDWRLP